MMPSPFLGMDPFLEVPHIWPDFHQDLAVEIKGRLNQQIGPKYYAAVETYTIAEVRYSVVRLYVTETGQLITAIEILSPANKQGEGLAKYRLKRRRLLESPVHLVELDLLRGGTRPGPEVANPPLDTDYILLVNRYIEAEAGRLSEIWPVAINESLPHLPIPLLTPDPDITLDLGAAITTVYKRSNYQWRIDYDQTVPPPQLRPVMAEWWAKHLSGS